MGTFHAMVFEDGGKLPAGNAGNTSRRAGGRQSRRNLLRAYGHAKEIPGNCHLEQHRDLIVPLRRPFLAAHRRGDCA